MAMGPLLACEPLQGTWGCEPVCCGQACTTPSCPNDIWLGETNIHEGMSSACCDSLTSQGLDGVLCCKTPAADSEPMEMSSVDGRRPEPIGRTLSPVDVTTYAWVYVISGPSQH